MSASFNHGFSIYQFAGPINIWFGVILCKSCFPFRVNPTERSKGEIPNFSLRYATKYSCVLTVIKSRWIILFLRYKGCPIFGLFNLKHHNDNVNAFLFFEGVGCSNLAIFKRWKFNFWFLWISLWFFKIFYNKQ